MELIGSYDVVVAGAGIAGVVAALRSAREGAKTLLLEASGFVGGLVTGGRQTKPTGVINGGTFRELLNRCIVHKGWDPIQRESFWGAYTGAFDAETMQRVMMEAVEEAGVEVLLHAPVVQAIKEGNVLTAVEIQTKSGSKLVLGKVFVDATGDGDLAALAGAEFMLGRPRDGLTQPITSYLRILNVNIPAVVEDCKTHMDDMWELTIPEKASTNEDYVLVFFTTGFTKRIQEAKKEGFNWTVPKDHMSLKAGAIPGEVIVNVTRVHGNALDFRTVSRAEFEVRKQAYCAFDFLKRYVKGFEAAVFLEVAPKLGVRETRRIKGQYVLTGADVRSQVRYDDAIGLCNSPVDIHEPGGVRATMENVGTGYAIPLRCLVPENIEGLFVAGRCISVDSTAYGSTRNLPACAMTGEAAGAAAAYCVTRNLPTPQVSVTAVQQTLRTAGVVLGTKPETASVG
jgi:hypothetical protein